MVPGGCCLGIKCIRIANMLTICSHRVHDTVVVDHEQMPRLRTSNLWWDLFRVSAKGPEVLRALRTVYIRCIESAEIGRLQNACRDTTYVPSERMVRGKDLALELAQQLFMRRFRELAAFCHTNAAPNLNTTHLRLKFGADVHESPPSCLGHLLEAGRVGRFVRGWERCCMHIRTGRCSIQP